MWHQHHRTGMHSVHCTVAVTVNEMTDLLSNIIFTTKLQSKHSEKYGLYTEQKFSTKFLCPSFWTFLYTRAHYIIYNIYIYMYIELKV